MFPPHATCISSREPISLSVIIVLNIKVEVCTCYNWRIHRVIVCRNYVFGHAASVPRRQGSHQLCGNTRCHHSRALCLARREPGYESVDCSEKFMIRRLLCAAMVLNASAARAQDVAAFYRGKQLRFVVGSAVGGAYDMYARALA